MSFLVVDLVPSPGYIFLNLCLFDSCIRSIFPVSIFFFHHQAVGLRLNLWRKDEAEFWFRKFCVCLILCGWDWVVNALEASLLPDYEVCTLEKMLWFYFEYLRLYFHNRLKTRFGRWQFLASFWRHFVGLIHFLHSPFFGSDVAVGSGGSDMLSTLSRHFDIHPVPVVIISWYSHYRLEPFL